MFLGIFGLDVFFKEIGIKSQGKTKKFKEKSLPLGKAVTQSHQIPEIMDVIILFLKFFGIEIKGLPS